MKFYIEKDELYPYYFIIPPNVINQEWAIDLEDEFVERYKKVQSLFEEMQHELHELSLDAAYPPLPPGAYTNDGTVDDRAIITLSDGKKYDLKKNAKKVK